MGAALALALAEAGANLHLIGRRLDLLKLVASKARSFGSDAVCNSCDLASTLGQLEVTHRLAQELPRLDILIQNAAMHVVSSIEQASLTEFDEMYRTNVRAPYVLAQGLLPLLKTARGQVVFINSSKGIAAGAMSAQYDSTKHALRAIADSLRAEVNAYGIRVMTVYLGRTASGMQHRIHQMECKSYRPELLVQPEDVASVILNALSLPRTAEITDVHMRPVIRS